MRVAPNNTASFRNRGRVEEGNLQASRANLSQEEAVRDQVEQALFLRTSQLIEMKSAGTYEKALNNFYRKSYRIKKSESFFEELVFTGDNDQFKQFGLASFFFIEFVRTLMYLYLVIGVFSVIPMVINYSGNRLLVYQDSYSRFLAQLTLGNISGTTIETIFWMSIPDCLSVLLTVAYLIYWRSSSSSAYTEYYKNPRCIDPSKYTLVVSGFDEDERGLADEEELKGMVNRTWNCYECTFVYDFEGRLLDYKKLDDIETDIRNEELRISIGEHSSDEQLQELTNKKTKLEAEFAVEQVVPKVLKAYVHLESQSDKKSMIRYYENYSQTNSLGNKMWRLLCSCCRKRLPDEQKYRGQELLIVSTHPPNPQQIYWENADVTDCSKFVRSLILLLVLLAMLIICCGIIALLNLYVSSTNSCSDFKAETTLAQAQASASADLAFCYCTANLVSLDTAVVTFCKAYQYKVVLQNGLQVAASISVSITNAVFIKLLSVIIPYMRPDSKSTTVRIQTVLLLIATFINTALTPLLMNAEIFGVKPVGYLSFIFDLSRFKFYTDFNTFWYYFVGPYFMNFMIITAVMPLVDLLVVKLLACYSDHKARQLEGTVIQKQLNEKLTVLELNLGGQLSQLFMLFFVVNMFSAGMPVMNAFFFVFLLLKYLVLKHLMIAHATRISGINETVNDLVIKVLPWGLVLHLVVGVWMVTAPDIFSFSSFSQFKIPVKSGVDVVDRYLYMSYMVGVLALVVAFILYDSVAGCLGSVKECLCPDPLEGVTGTVAKFSKLTFNATTLISYRMSENDDYAHIRQHLNRTLNSTMVQQ